MLIQALNWLCGVDSGVQSEKTKKAKESCERAYRENLDARTNLIISEARTSAAVAMSVASNHAVVKAVDAYKKKSESGEHNKVRS